MRKEEGVGRKEGACAFRLRCRGFLLIGGEIYWVPVRVTRDLKPHIVGVIKPQEICIRSDRYSLSLSSCGEKRRRVTRFERNTAVQHAEEEKEEEEDVVYSDFNFSKLERASMVAQLNIANCRRGQYEAFNCTIIILRSFEDAPCTGRQKKKRKRNNPFWEG